MRGILLLAFVFGLLSSQLQESDAQDLRTRVLIGAGTIAAGLIFGSQKAEAERKAEASAKFSNLLGTRVDAQAVQANSTVAKVSNTGMLYRLGPGWGTTADYCVSYITGLCSPCDRNPSLGICVIRTGDSILRIDGATIR